MTTRTHPEATCTDCSRYGPIKARGRCTACYTRAYRSGALDGTIRERNIERVQRHRPCVRCGLPTLTEERLCRDCGTVLRRIAEPTAEDGCEAEWVRVGMVWKPVGAQPVETPEVEVDRGGRPPKPDPPCGTERGYQRHRHRGEDCEQCRAAHAAHWHWTKHQRQQEAS